MHLFITFTTYGTWLHGDSRGSYVCTDHGSKQIGYNPALNQFRENNLESEPVSLDKNARKIVLNSILETARIKGESWRLEAIHVRTTHVHLILVAEQDAKTVLKTLKANCTSSLRQAGKRYKHTWTRGGCIARIFKDVNLLSKTCYVLFEQGRPMEWYCRPELYERAEAYFKHRSQRGE